MRVIPLDELSAWLAEHAIEIEPPAPSEPPERLCLIWPTTLAKTVTQRYGINPQWYKVFGLAGHEGIDIYAPNGAPILAMAAGTISRVEHNAGSGNYGIHVRIEHQVGAQRFETIYAHFQKAEVAVGQRVEAGQRIGLADNTGNSTGPHLHITLKKRGDGSPWLAPNTEIVNPTPYMPDLWWPGRSWRVDVGGNLRRDPRESGALIRFVAVGARVSVHDIAGAGDEWWLVEIDGARGYFWNPGYKLQPA